jgi:hypothetical protein
VTLCDFRAVCGLPYGGPRRLTVLKTLGAAVGALIVILFLAIAASRMAAPPEAVAEAAALRR